MKMNVIRPSFSHWNPGRGVILLTALIALTAHLSALVLGGLILQPLLRLSNAILLRSLIDTQEPSLTIKCYSAGVRIVEPSSARLFQKGKATRRRFQWKGIQGLLISRLPSMHSYPPYPPPPPFNSQVSQAHNKQSSSKLETANSADAVAVVPF